MTNEMIILQESIKLMEQGILQSTGKMTTIDGKQIDVPEQIHTFQRWKELGFSVKKGEHAIAKFPVWKFKAGKKENDDDQVSKDKMFLKMSAFFKAEQVERRKDEQSDL